jgi:hypothetical protein
VRIVHLARLSTGNERHGDVNGLKTEAKRGGFAKDFNLSDD